MNYFVVSNEHDVIFGVTEVTYQSFTNRFVPATDEQVELYEKLQALLDEDFYVQVSDVVKPTRQEVLSTASAETLAAIKSMFNNR